MSLITGACIAFMSSRTLQAFFCYLGPISYTNELPKEALNETVLIPNSQPLMMGYFGKLVGKSSDQPFDIAVRSYKLDESTSRCYLNHRLVS